MASNDTILARVRKLLDVAEHPNTPAGEADAAAQAAERLIAKYAIDEAMLEAASATRSTPEVQTIVIDAPYATAKTVLISAVAAAHGVRAITHSGNSPVRVSLVGFTGDLQLVDLLYTSLLLQATTSLRRQPATGRAFRRAFLIGFAGEVGRRLHTAREDAVASTGTASTALVLRDRDQAVEETMREKFPRLRSARLSVSDGRGLSAGRQSGATANLSTGDNQIRGGRTALGG
jgi:hypothetical protein